MKYKQIIDSVLVIAIFCVVHCDASPIEKRSESCSISIYDGRSFKGDFLATSRDSGFSHVHIHEESVQTFGNCCWRLFKERGHRGQSKIIRGNRDFPTPSHWTWSSGQVKSVRKCDSCRDCSRHNKRSKHKRKMKKEKSYLKCFFNPVSCW